MTKNPQSGFSEANLCPWGTWERSTYYVRDAQGSVLSVYEHGARPRGVPNDDEVESVLTCSESHIYGSTRLGMLRGNAKVSKLWMLEVEGDYVIAEAYFDPMPEEEVCEDDHCVGTYSAHDGRRMYELSNHLGNVNLVISDRKTVDEYEDDLVLSYASTVLQVTDYYPFGMVMPGRQQYAESGYRYGFQNQETDQELWDGAVSYRYRIEDPRIARFFVVDPLTHDYPMLSNYAFSGNQVIHTVEVEGLEPEMFLNPNLQKGIITPASDSQHQHEPLLAGARDGAYIILQFMGLNLVDDLVVDLLNPDLSTEDKTAAVLEATQAAMWPGPVGKGSTPNIILKIESAEAKAAKLEAQATKLNSVDRSGQNFTPAGKKNVIESNKLKNEGKTICYYCKQETIPSQQSQKGVTTPKNATQVDHKTSKANNGQGTPANGVVSCADCNSKKGSLNELEFKQNLDKLLNGGR